MVAPGTLLVHQVNAPSGYQPAGAPLEALGRQLWATAAVLAIDRRINNHGTTYLHIL